ncbi:MAG: lasso peptide biosynthesis B2 protein [Pyrinomonadaceae bacterium]|nr:lasso peptide biosynthesis B2 protein [Pyrinomonadaceae bacterium]
MRSALRFLSSPAAERRILIKAVTLLWIVRIGLWILPFQRLRTLLSIRSANIVATKSVPVQAERIARCVKVMSRFVPAATCLAQSLVTVKLLEDAGFPACLRIGVARDKSGELEAHAWVESKGKVIIGGTHADLQRFTVLHAVEGT